ncbi:MAG: fused MFS/spermidine synthase, partial [Candidatus Binatia bacterium]
AFDADTVPFHLTTVEFLNEVKAILRPGGVVTANVARLGPGILYRSMIRTFTVCFPQVYLFPVPNRGNIVVVATREERRRGGEEIAASIRALKQEAGRALDLLEVTGPLLEEKPVVADAPILTDDYAPVDLLRYREGL